MVLLIAELAKAGAGVGVVRHCRRGGGGVDGGFKSGDNSGIRVRGRLFVLVYASVGWGGSGSCSGSGRDVVRGVVGGRSGVVDRGVVLALLTAGEVHFVCVCVCRGSQCL